jgi:hypothetical protein
MRKTIVATLVLLLAPPAFAAENVTISTAATSGGTLSGGVFTPTADDANLNITDLKTALASSDVTVNTGTTGSQSGNITLANKMFWPANLLYLMSNNSININAKLSATGTSGLKLRTPHGGTLNFSGTGKITFASTSQFFRIGTTTYTLVADLPTLALDISGTPSGDFALVNNYDASVVPNYFSSPVATEFIGDFNALGNSIANLSISSNTTGQDDALFAWVGPNGSVENLSLTNLFVRNTSSNSRAAGMVVVNEGALNNDSVSGTVTQSGTGAIAGLVCTTSGTIENSFSTASVSANSWATVGGLVGANTGTVANSYATGSVAITAGTTSDSSVGGLVGMNEANITQSFATGNVTGIQFGFAGGLVGKNQNGDIDQSYATGNVSGGDTSYDGGLVGYTNTTGGIPNTISNSYANGSVSGGSNAFSGGLIGFNQNSAISSSYSIGEPTALGASPHIGGFVGEDSGGSNTDNYWSTTSSGITDLSQGAGAPPNDPGITGLTNTQFRSGLPTGFSSSIWGETTGVNFGLPYLLALPPS